MREKPGQIVFISQDCRSNGNATGKYGIYEGDMPFLIIVFGQGGSLEYECQYTNETVDAIDDYGLTERGEFSKEAAKSLGIRLPMTDENSTQDEQMQALGKIWDEARKMEAASAGFYQIHRNPRIRLEDGTRIWGCECYWKAVECKVAPEQIAAVLESDQQGISKFQSMFANLLEAIAQ